MSPFEVEIFTDDSPCTETSKLMYNWSFLFEVLQTPTLLPSTFNGCEACDVVTIKMNLT